MGDRYGRVPENQENEWTCPNCKRRWGYQGDDPPVPCASCGYSHENIDPKDIPSEIKYPL